MSRRFQDVYGRVTARDPKILESLETAFKTSSSPLLAQAGIEIECLQGDIVKLKAQLEEADATIKSLKVKPPVPPKPLVKEGKGKL